jgi:spore maturation protein CgeB
VRVLILDTCYPGFLREHYERSPELRAAPYRIQWEALMARHFGTADAYSHYLRELGHEAHEVVANCRPLQLAWAREHGLRPSWLRRHIAPETVLLAQAEWFAPDVVYVQDLRAFSPKLLGRLRALAPTVGQTASELPGAETLAELDLIVTSFPHYVERLTALGHATEYLRIGFDPRVLVALGDIADERGAVFVGSLVPGKQHTHGNALLAAAAERVEIDFWGPGAESWPESSPIRRRHHGDAWGLDMYRVLAGARVALNRHIDVAGEYANNMRLYEATGVGTALVTDAKRNLAELFEPGSELLTYSTADELAEQARRLLSDDDERTAIARAGQARTLRDHTYAQRMRELVEILAARGV